MSRCCHTDFKEEVITSGVLTKERTIDKWRWQEKGVLDERVA